MLLGSSHALAASRPAARGGRGSSSSTTVCSQAVRPQRRPRAGFGAAVQSEATCSSRDVRARAADADAEAGAGSGQWYTRPCGPNSVEVTSVQELIDVLATDQLVIVDFFAPWCGACRALFPKLHKLLQEYPDVVLVKVNFEANKAMCKSLGIKVLPFFHFYHGAQGRVAAFSATVSKLDRIKEALELHSGAICSLEAPNGLPEFPGVHASVPLDASRVGRDGWEGAATAAAAGGGERVTAPAAAAS